MAEQLQDEQKQETSEEFQNFQRVVKAAFTTPKAEVDAAIKEDNKKARKRVEVKRIVPKK